MDRFGLLGILLHLSIPYPRVYTRYIQRKPIQGYTKRVFEGGAWLLWGRILFLNVLIFLTGSSGVLDYVHGYGYEEWGKDLKYISKSSPKLFNIQDCFIFSPNFFPLTFQFSFLINKMDIPLSLLKWKQHSHPQKIINRKESW